MKRLLVQWPRPIKRPVLKVATFYCKRDPYLLATSIERPLPSSDPPDEGFLLSSPLLYGHPKVSTSSLTLLWKRR